MTNVSYHRPVPQAKQFSLTETAKPAYSERSGAVLCRGLQMQRKDTKMTFSPSHLGWLNLVLLSWCMACRDEDAPAARPSVDGGLQGGDRDGATPGDDQTPPQGAAKLDAWLKTGAYKVWSCESDVHARRIGSGHGANRICSNALISANSSATTDWPQGAASVKELYASESDTSPHGYAVYLKTEPDSAGGAAWYWYEVIDGSVIADGLGDSGAAKTLCVGCHSGAGTGQGGSPGARDHVFTPVP